MSALVEAEVGSLDPNYTYRESHAPYDEPSQEFVLDPVGAVQNALGPQFQGLSESELIEALLEQSEVDPEELAEFLPLLAAALPAIGSAILPAVSAALPAIGKAAAGAAPVISNALGNIAGNILPNIAKGAIQGLAGGGGLQGALAGAATSAAGAIPGLVSGLLQPQPALPAPPVLAPPAPTPQPPGVLPGGIPWPIPQIRPPGPVPGLLRDIKDSVTRLENMLQKMQQTLTQHATPTPQIKKQAKKRRRGRSAARPAAPGAAPEAASAAEDLATVFSSPSAWTALTSALAGPEVGSRQVAVQNGPVPTMVDVGAVLNTIGQVVQRAATERTTATGGEEIPEYMIDPDTGELREGLDDPASVEQRIEAVMELLDEENRYQQYQYRRRARAYSAPRERRRRDDERRSSRIIDDGSPSDRGLVNVARGRILDV